MLRRSARSRRNSSAELLPGFPATLLEGPLHDFLDDKSKKELAKHPQLSSLPVYQYDLKKNNKQRKPRLSEQATTAASTTNLTLWSAELTKPVSSISILPGSVSFETEPEKYSTERLYTLFSSKGSNETYGFSETLQSSGSGSQSGVSYAYEEYQDQYKKYHYMHQSHPGYTECQYTCDIEKYRYTRIHYHIDHGVVTVEDKGNFSNNHNNQGMSKIFFWVAPLFLLFGWRNFFEALARLAKADNKNYVRFLECGHAFINAFGATLIFALTLSAVAGFVYALPSILGVLLALNIVRSIVEIVECLNLANKSKTQQEKKRHLKNGAYHGLGILMGLLSFMATCFATYSFVIKSETTINASDLSYMDLSDSATNPMDKDQFGSRVAQYLQNRVNTANSLSNVALSLVIAVMTISLPSMILRACALNRETLEVFRRNKKVSATFEGIAYKRIKSVFRGPDKEASALAKAGRMVLAPLIISTYGITGLGHFLLVRGLALVIMAVPQFLANEVRARFPKKEEISNQATQNTRQILATLQKEKDEIARRRDTGITGIANKLEKLQKKIDRNDKKLMKYQGQHLLLSGALQVLVEQTADENRPTFGDEAKRDLAEVRAEEVVNSRLQYQALEKLENRIKDGKKDPASERGSLAAVYRKIKPDFAYSNIYQNFHKKINNTQRLVTEAKEVLNEHRLLQTKLSQLPTTLRFEEAFRRPTARAAARRA